MNTYIRQMKSFLKQRPLKLNSDESDSLLDVFWKNYTRSNPTEDDSIIRKFEFLEQLKGPISQKRKNEICMTVAELCIEHEHIAFIHGFRMGVRMVLECMQEEI